MWHSCALWSQRDGDTRRIDGLAPYMTKGKQVSVDGSLKYNVYTNRDGVEVKAVNINAREIVLLGNKDDDVSDNVTSLPTRNDGIPSDDDIPF
jgi:single-stranded DNA-binding protein